MTATGWTEGNPFAKPGERVARPPARKGINSQAKGKRAERDLANWWKTHGFPDASRAVKTGDMYAPDGGDLVLEHRNFRLVIEVKHHAGGLTDGQVTEYGAKLVRQTAQSKGTMGVLVERRDRVSDPGRWWVHLDPGDFAYLVIGQPRFHACPVSLACRTTVGYFAELLQVVVLAEKG